jgi:tRNA 2-thiouridine synthesizing protein A
MGVPDKFLDMKGKVCPIPAAETRKMLKNMAIGEVLEIVGDFEPALENVIRMAKNNGGEILESESRPNHFRVVTRKYK